MHTILRACLLAAAGFLGCGAAQATTLTFDGFVSPTMQLSYDESDYFFEGSSGILPLSSWGNGEPNDADPSNSATMHGSYAGDAVKMWHFGPVPFTFTSIDLADNENSGVADQVAFTFSVHNGPELHFTVTLDATKGLQTFSFGVADVDWVTWVNLNPAGLQPQFDNVVASIAVASTPIPATLPLLASALGGLGFLGFKKRRAAAV